MNTTLAEMPMHIIIDTIVLVIAILFVVAITLFAFIRTILRRFLYRCNHCKSIRMRLETYPERNATGEHIGDKTVIRCLDCSRVETFPHNQKSPAVH